MTSRPIQRELRLHGEEEDTKFRVCWYMKFIAQHHECDDWCFLTSKVKSIISAGPRRRTVVPTVAKNLKISWVIFHILISLRINLNLRVVAL